MISARDFERHLIGIGFTKSKLDMVTRGLREEKRIPLTGRGLYAARIDSRIAATILVAYLGCSKAVNAAARLKKLETARSGDGEQLLDVVSQLLVDPLPFQELRVSRVGRRARLILPHGQSVWFTKTGAPPSPDHVDVEGVVTPSIVNNIVTFISGGTPVVRPLDEPNDAE